MSGWGSTERDAERAAGVGSGWGRARPQRRAAPAREIVIAGPEPRGVAARWGDGVPAAAPARRAAAAEHSDDAVPPNRRAFRWGARPADPAEGPGRAAAGGNDDDNGHEPPVARALPRALEPGGRLGRSRAVAAAARAERQLHLHAAFLNDGDLDGDDVEAGGWGSSRSGWGSRRAAASARRLAVRSRRSGLREESLRSARAAEGDDGPSSRSVSPAAVGGAAAANSATPSPVMANMRSLLFSPLCSDVRFICDDDTALNAHKCVLAATSDYFATAFEGPWGSTAARLGRPKDDGNADGGDQLDAGASKSDDGAMIWPTSNSPHIMRAVLSFVYTGSIEDTSGKLPALPIEVVDPRALLSVAHEYGLQPLLEEAEKLCFQDMSVENWKETLQLANLYGCEILKALCFSFCKDRATDLLTDPDVAALAAADRQLWDELSEALKRPGAAGTASLGGGGAGVEGGEEGRKRKRTQIII